MNPILARLNRVWRGAMTGVCFALFGLGGLLLSLIWFNLLLIVIRNKPRRRRLARRSIAASFRLFLAVVRAVGVLDYRIEGGDILRQERGCLVVANHPSLIDYVMLASIMPETDCMVKSALLKNIESADTKLQIATLRHPKDLLVEANNLSVDYGDGPIFSPLRFEIRRGDRAALQGKNGCGKSTLAKHFNAILLPESGTVLVEDMDTRTDEKLYDIRQKVGMVFQNPDNQIVATVVEEDVAFALENLGVPTGEMRTRVDDAMKLAGIYEQRNKAPHKLSGGQKQRVAIAGVIAMRPDCLILDESTAMLDPRGRAQVMKTIRNLRDAGISIVSITHYMEEAAQADRILVMSRGRIVMEGTPEQVFSQTKRLHGYHLDVPQATELRDELAAAGLPMPENIITPEECAKAIFDLLK